MNAQLVLPSSNPSGQAQHTIAGFRYQLLQSMLALLQLRQGDQLWLEISEDYSVVSEGEQIDFQVKNSQALRGPPSYSLQSKAVRDAIVRFFDASRDRPERSRRLVFLARGGASRERGHSLPGGATGLAYWQSAALDADCQPLREVLARTLDGTSVAEWLASEPSDHELRSRLLRRITWQLDERPSDAIRKVARDQLRSILRSRNLPVSSADIAVDTLMSFIFDAASAAESADRRLVADDLEAELDRVAGQKWVGEQRMRMPSLAENLLLSWPVASPSAALRRATVEEIIAGAKGRAVIWLHGAHGVGKSTLARLTAPVLGGTWVQLDLGPVRNDAMGALSAWAEVAQGAMAGELNGIILDNVTDEAGDVVLERMEALSGTFLASGGRVIVTSHQKPGALQLGGVGIHMVAAPYFSEDDVTELISQEPSPDPEMVRAWALFTRMSAAGGHPALVSTKLASLRARGWPLAAMMEDIEKPGESTKLTREASRRKLVRELQDLDDALSLDARLLLKRIANVFDRVDEKLVHLLAQQEPVLRNASDALAVLKGTWLETLPHGGLRVSPLISDIGIDIGLEESRRIKQLASVHWMSGRVLDERTLPLCFWNAFWGKQDWVLTKLSETLQVLSAEKLRAAAPMLSPITMLVTDKELYDGNPITAVSIRVIQFAVADALDNQDVSTRSAERLLVELGVLPEHIKALMTLTSMFRVLLAEADLTPALRLECARRLREALPIAVGMAEDFPDPNRLLPPQFRADMDAADFLVTRLVQKVRSTDKLVEALMALDAADAQDRDRYLDAISLMYGGLAVFASSGWSADQIGGADMEQAIEGYNLAGSITQGWGRPDLALELDISKSIVLDESLSRKDEALALIDEAIGRYGLLPNAIRQRARVLRHMGRHRESAELTLSIEDDLSLDDTLERSLALRDGAVSLAKTGNFPEAARLFAKAGELLADSDTQGSLGTGMKIDHALAVWRDGKRSDAIVLAAAILVELERYDQTSSRQAERSHQYGRGLVGLFSTERSRSVSPPPPFDFGQASQIELSTAPLMLVELTTLADNWRLLVSADADIGGSAIESVSLAKQDGRLSVVIERDVLHCKYAYAMSNGNIDDAFRALVEMANLAKIPTEPGDRFKRAPSELFARAEADMNDPELRKLLVQGLLDAIASQVVRATYDRGFLRELASSFRAKFLGFEAADSVLNAATRLFGLVSERSSACLIASAITVSSSSIKADATTRFVRDMTLLSHTEYSLIRDELLPLVIDLIVRGWVEVGAEIEGDFRTDLAEALAKGGSSAERRAAEVLLTVKDWVEHQFAEPWFDILERLGTEGFGRIGRAA